MMRDWFSSEGCGKGCYYGRGYGWLGVGSGDSFSYIYTNVNIYRAISEGKNHI